MADWAGHYEGKGVDQERLARHAKTDIIWKVESAPFLELYKALVAELS